MIAVKFSERILRAIESIKTREMNSKELENFYNNATRDQNITEAEREAVITALETRIRISAPGMAKTLFGPKDADGRVLLDKVHDALAAEFDLSKNTVGARVKTGGRMIRGEVHVDVYISYKAADRRHLNLTYLQRKPEDEPTLVVRLYQTGPTVTEPQIYEEFCLASVDLATACYRAHLEELLDSNS